MRKSFTHRLCRQTSIAALVVFGALTSATTQAGVIVDTGPANPSGVIQQHVADAQAARSQRDTPGLGNNERIFGQTFTAPTPFTMNAISLKTASATNFAAVTPSALQIKIFDMSDGDGVPAGDVTDDAGFPDSDNTLLATYNFDVSSLAYPADTWLRLNLDSTLDLTSGRLYGFLVFWDNEDVDNTFDIRHSGLTGSTLVGGTLRTEPSGGNYNDTNWTGANPWTNVQTVVSDLTFVIHATPEPASIAIWIIVAVALAAFGWRRRLFAHRALADVRS